MGGIPLPFGDSHYPLGGVPVPFGDPITHWGVHPLTPPPQFCGCTIAGLSLLSAAVMRLRSVGDPQEWAELLLEPLSLYVLR